MERKKRKKKKTSYDSLLEIKSQAISYIDSEWKGSNTLKVLKKWWCLQYNRPFLDPLFNEYSLEELILEFFIVTLSESPEQIKLIKAEISGQAINDEKWLDEMVLETESKIGDNIDIKELQEGIEESFEVNDGN